MNRQHADRFYPTLLRRPDGTLLGYDEATQRFRLVWESLPRERRPWLVYNTGRRVDNVQFMIAQGILPPADAIIGSVGTELHADSNSILTVEFQARFGGGWNLATVETVVGELPGVQRQPPEYIHPYKSSWFWPRASLTDRANLQRRLEQAGIRATLVYSSERFLDILPSSGDKGQALTWLCQRLNIPFERVLVAGDTGNDSSMFRLKNVQRIVVENALPELLAECVGYPKYMSRQIMADGVLDGLLHFGVIDKLQHPSTLPEPPRLFWQTPLRDGPSSGLSREPWEE